MTAFGGVIFGFVGDRFGRKPTIIISVLVYGIGTTLCAASHSLLQLLLFRSFTGLGIGGEWAAGAEPGRGDRAGGTTRALRGLRAGRRAARSDARGGGRRPYRAADRMAQRLSALVGAVVHRRRDRMAMAAGERRVAAHASVIDGSARTRSAALRPYRRIIGLLFIVLLVNSAAYWFTYTWMPSYLRIARELTPQASGNLMIWMQSGALVGYAAFGVLADRFGRRPVFSVYASLMASACCPRRCFGIGRRQRHGLIRAGFDRRRFRHRHLVGRGSDDLRDVADQRAQYRARPAAQRHPRHSVLHPADHHRAEPAARLRTDARDRRAVLGDRARRWSGCYRRRAAAGSPRSTRANQARYPGRRYLRAAHYHNHDRATPRCVVFRRARVHRNGVDGDQRSR